jgi:methionine synthase II (cobalamin-independent)
MTKFKGLSTGIGSLPHEDAARAVDLVFKYVQNIPFWPQLPRRDFREGMLIQFSEKIPCVRLIDKGLYFDPNEDELERFYAKIIEQDLEYFKISKEFALGLYEFHRRLKERSMPQIEFLKGQITGPFTFAASINDSEGLALINNAVYMQVIIKGLIMKALWQIKFFQEFGKKVVIFIDEPFLSCFGSGFTPLNREDVCKGLSEVADAIKQAGGLVGVHCCGNTDWSIFTEIKGIDIINFDAFDFMERFILYGDYFRAFLKRGGLICWGIVPTQLFTGEETTDLLVRRIRDGINKLVAKGVEESLIVDGLLLSPSCGLGTFTPEKAEKIFTLLADTSESIRKFL